MELSGEAATRRAPLGGWVALAVVALGAWGLRVAPLLDRGGAFGYPVDYDEGVYFSAAALAWQGVWPYRDFTFVHPPGVLLAWAPGALVGAVWDAALGFALTRWQATLVGLVNVLLVARLAARSWGRVAGLVAALVYATYPEAVAVERGPFLEPVLNLVCLALAQVWAGSAQAERPRWAWAGALCGLALAVKVVGGLWLVAALVARWPRPSLASHLGLVGVAGAVALAVVGPLAALAPERFVGDVLLFQSLRPGDGELSRWARLQEVWSVGRLGGLALALGALVRVGRRLVRGQAEPLERMAAVAYVLAVAAFLSTPSYWSQYNAHLAVPESLLAGLGAGALHAWSERRPRLARAVALALVVLTPLPALQAVLHGSRRRSHDLVALGHYLRQQVPPQAAVCAFEPAWTLAGGRLPPAGAGVPTVVDSYAWMLKGALASGERFESKEAAFPAPGAQRLGRELLERCRFLVVGERGRRQLSEESLRWLERHFERRFVGPRLGELDVWEQAAHAP